MALRYLFLSGLLCLLVACGLGNPLALPTDTPLPPTPAPEPTATPSPGPDSIFGFKEFLAQAESARPDQRQDLVNRYIAQLAKAPITDDGQAVFLWQGAADSIQLIGDMNNWSQEEAQVLSRLAGTDLWYLVAEFEPDARLDYLFRVDSQQNALDPLNAQTIMSSSGPNSVLVMPEYQTPLELMPPDVEIPHGTLTSHTLDSNYLNQTRTFFVYEPAGQLVGRKLPTVYINNGSDYLNLIDATEILDRLIARRLIPPLLAVFIPPINVVQEYSLNDAYLRFLAEELVPFVQQTYDTDLGPEVTGVLGSAEGGLAAVYAALKRPDVFGLAAGQSGTYAANGDALIQQFARQRSGQANLDPVRYYLVVGSYETAVDGDDHEGNVLAANQRLAEKIGALDQDLLYEVRPEGHSWGLWRGTLGRALRFLYTGEI